MAYQYDGIFGKQTVYTVEYMCRDCGMKVPGSSRLGRPQPGFCSRRPKIGGKPMPHRWVQNRKY